MVAAIKAYHRRRGWMAWHVAALGRMEEFPDLGTLTGTAKREPEKTAEQMQSEWARNSMMWAIATGGMTAEQAMQEH